MVNKPNADQKKGTRSAAPTASAEIDAVALRQETELRAYYRYCERGCAPGADVDDWLAAEQELLAERGEGRAVVD